MTKLTQSRLKELLTYDPATGEFRWRVTLGSRAHAGDLAGTTKVEGYVQLQIDGRLYYAHRLAILYMTGKWPEKWVDHQNRSEDDNSYRNLRPSSVSQNAANSKTPTHNTSGRKGVSWDKKKQKWGAKIQHLGRQKFLGYFEDIDQAATAYANAAKRIFGEFARP